jgi:hypothetical protein
MANRRRPVQIADVFDLDRRGLPLQVHFPTIPGLSRIVIGPAYPTRALAEAGPGHVLEVTVTAPGEIWRKTWFERSETGQPDMYGHTEQKAVLRMRLSPGLLIEMFGYHPPCPYENGCMNALEILARRHDVDFTYFVEQVDRSAVYDFSSTGRRSDLRPLRR